MNIQYWQPLEHGLRDMKRLLFQPFDIGRWFVLGFTAWLIHLGRSGGSSAGNNPEFRTDISDGDWEGAIDAIGEATSNIIPSGIALALLLTLVAFAIVVGIVLLWVGCRARFIWLENLTERTSDFRVNWSRYGRLGDSFFLWKIGFTLVLLMVVAPVAIFGGVIGAITGEGLGGPASVLGWMGLGFIIFIVAVVAGYIDFFAESFVTVIMHRRGLGVLAAWGEFRQLFEAHPGHFVLVGFMKLALHLVSFLVVIMVSLLTCCVGFLLLVIPYIGTVVLLPVYMGLRYYDLHWLGQFAPDLGGPTNNDGDAPLVTPPPQLYYGADTPESAPTPETESPDPSPDEPKPGSDPTP